jgi:Tol biopolymer transport system component
MGPRSESLRRRAATLVIQTLATGEWVNLTNPEGQRDNFPRWSPKGDWVAFTSNREADQEYRI